MCKIWFPVLFHAGVRILKNTKHAGAEEGQALVIFRFSLSGRCLIRIFALLKKDTHNGHTCNDDKIGCYGQCEENGHNGRYGIL